MDLTTSSKWLCNEFQNRTTGFAAGKIGSAELSAIVFYLHRKQNGNIPYPSKIRKEITVNAGLWEPIGTSLDTIIDIYAQDMIESLKNMDAVAECVPSMRQEEKLIHQYCCPPPKCTQIHSRAFEPFYTPEHMYTREMTAGPIAIVSPFAKTIRTQLEKRDLLFPTPIWLSSQEIIPIQGYYSPYLDPSHKVIYSPDIIEKGPIAAVDYLADKVIKSGAKYCLVGIGALSIPLVSRLKNAGIIAVHTGGGTQIICGIKGQRWLTHSVISQFFNTHWVFPSENEVPSNANSVERGCYW
jgi:hypothetical protein